MTTPIADAVRDRAARILSDGVDFADQRVTDLAMVMFLAEHPRANWKSGRLRWIWFERAATAIDFLEQRAAQSQEAEQ
jgi:hypothetical protein